MPGVIPPPPRYSLGKGPHWLPPVQVMLIPSIQAPLHAVREDTQVPAGHDGILGGQAPTNTENDKK